MSKKASDIAWHQAQKRSRGNRSVCIHRSEAGKEATSASLSCLEGEDGLVGEDRDGGLSKESSPDEALDEC